MLADHLPHELAVDPFHLATLSIAVAVIAAMVWHLSDRNWPVLTRAMLGSAVGIVTILPTMTWAYCEDSRTRLVLLSVLLASPALIALGHRAIPRPVVHGVFIVASVAVLGAFLIGQSVGCWRDESYIDEDANLYVLIIALPMVTTWLYAWSRSHEAAARAVVGSLRALHGRAMAWMRRHSASRAAARAPAPVVPSAPQVHRAQLLALMAVIPMIGGLILVTSVFLAPPGVVVFVLAFLLQRSARPVRAAKMQWSRPAVVLLTFTAFVTAVGALWLFTWAVAQEFAFSSPWSSVGLYFALIWSAVFVVLIVQSLFDRWTDRD